MVTTLITVGIACLLSAIIGGGFKGLGVEIPVLRSGNRQVMLAVAGVILLGSAAVAYHIQHRPDPELELSLGLKLYDAGQFAGALSHVAVAAQGGNHEAEYHYGEMLFRGEGCVPNQKEGNRWIRKAAESGYAPAEASLTMAYYEGGHGVEKDLKQARLWADRSAAQGDPRGLMYSAQLETDPEKRFDAMYKSANQGYAPAQVGLAALVVHRIAPRKPSKSGLSEIYDVIFWLSKAAEQGEPNAQVMLAKGLVGGTPGSDTTDTTDTLEIAYEWVCRALDRHDNRFPLVDLWRNAGLALRGQIEAVLPGDAQLRALSSNKSWQPKPDLPYRHGD